MVVHQNLTNLAGYFNFSMCEKYRTLSIAKMKHAHQHYIKEGLSREMYERNYTEQYAQTFETYGLAVFKEWKKYR